MFGILTKIANQIASLPGNIIQTLRDGYNKMYLPENNNIPPPEIKQLMDDLNKDKEPTEIQDINKDSDSEYDTAESEEEEEEVVAISPILNFVRREHAKIGREIVDSNHIAMVPDGMPGEDDYITLLQNNQTLITNMFSEERKQLGNIKVRMGIKCTMKRITNYMQGLFDKILSDEVDEYDYKYGIPRKSKNMPILKSN